MELIKEAVPRAKTIGVLATGEASSKLQIAEAQKIASPLGVKLVGVEVEERDYERAFAILVAEKVNALFVLASPILNAGRDRIIQLAASTVCRHSTNGPSRRTWAG